MPPNSIHHCSLVVRDVDRAAAFYRDVLGLQEIAIPPTFPPDGLEVRWFQIGSQQIHLIRSSEPSPPGQRHLALQVENAWEARALLQNKGITIQETVPIPGAERFFISDPDGNWIEIVEWLEAYSDREIPRW